MKKISNEIKVGTAALVTIAAFIWLYSFLKGKDLFNPAGTYYVVYQEIGGLTETNPVEINGYKAGVVQSITFINDKTGRLLVKLSVDKDFVLPEGTVAEITTASLIAGMKIILDFGSGPGVYNCGDTIPGRLATSIITRFQNEFTPLREKVNVMITTLDSVLMGINDVLTPAFRKDLRGSMANLNSASRNINEMISSEDKGMKKMVADMSVFSKMISDNTGKLSNTINNLSNVSDSLAAADLQSTIMNLKSTLESTSALLSRMNNGEGSAGMFMTDDSLYTNLSRSIGSLDLLLKDLKDNPKRYVHFSLFGGKK